MADDELAAVLARVLGEHGWDYARNRCACSAAGVSWFGHPRHVAELQLAALRREERRG